MNAGKQAAWLFLALIGLAFSSWYFAASDTVKKLDDKTLSTTVDTIVHNLQVRQYNEKGELANLLITPKLLHIPKENSHWFQSPYIKVAQDNQPPWEIRASQAKSINGGEQITLSENVVIHQKSPQGISESTLKTEEILYFPQKKMATTKKHVMFEQPGQVVQSEGMMAWLAEKRVKLLGNARGSYDPKHG